MKKVFLLLVLLHSLCSISHAETIDTIYYDKNWRGVPKKEFADYVRYATTSDNSNYQNRVRDYFITGGLQGEGSFIYIDKFDDSKSIFNGEIRGYYRSGKLAMVTNYSDRRKNGAYIEYYENGLVRIQTNYKDDKFDGVYYHFTEDGNACAQTEYQNGEPKYPYYVRSDKDGHVAKYNIKDNSLYLEKIQPNDLKIEYKDGAAWLYYLNNGLMIGINISYTNSYGKYYTANIVVTNNSLEPFTFDPDVITAYHTKKDKSKSMRIYSCYEYMKKVTRKQNFSAIMNSFGESATAANAGYSGSVAQINSTGPYSSSTTITSATYSGIAQYQADLIASQRVANYRNSLLQERKAKYEGYLKTTTVHLGETISGYVNIGYEKSGTMTLNVSINGIDYPFIWPLK